MEKIPTKENGLEATRKRENELHPTDAKGKKFVWWDRRSHVFQLLVGNSNALIDEVVDLRNELHAANNKITTLTNRVTRLENEPPFP